VSAHPGFDGWHRLPLASLDFETTGVDPLRDRILSYALLTGHDGVRTGMIDPGVPIPPESAEVHGITASMLRGAPPSAEGLAVVVEWVQSLIDRQVGLVVFNASYDLTMLRAEADRHGIAQPDWARLKVVDPFVVDWGVGRETRRLVDVATAYGVSVERAHDAVCDARAAHDVAVEIGARHPQIGMVTLAQLMANQRLWFADRTHLWNAAAEATGRRFENPAGWPLSA
jgi:DNA polymerase III subunit epsilon